MRMKKHLFTLPALLALTALAACGKPGATDNLVASSEVPEAVATETNDASAEEPGNDVAAAAPSISSETQPSKSPVVETAFDPKNATIVIDGQKIVLKDGLFQAPAAPGSASLVTTRYLGKDAHGDLTNDGKDDLAYFITHDGGGSGLFHYVVVAINGANGYKTTNAFLVGDRIDPQSLRITANRLEVNFMGRAKDEPMAAKPSRPSILLLKVTPGGKLEGLMK